MPRQLGTYLHDQLERDCGPKYTNIINITMTTPLINAPNGPRIYYIRRSTTSIMKCSNALLSLSSMVLLYKYWYINSNLVCIHLNKSNALLHILNRDLMRVSLNKIPSTRHRQSHVFVNAIDEMFITAMLFYMSALYEGN